MTLLLVLTLLVAWPAHSSAAQELPRGTIVDDVKCAADPSQSYALYLPSAYSADRKWSLLLAFHPGARGRAMVEKYQAAAEQYGYIIAASNTSRNGPWSVSVAAVKAMSGDVLERFSIDPRRIYATGMSGGARVAMMIALSNDAIAGVIASSAGYPDSQPRANVKFAVFGTAGTDDFNYVEMQMLDRKLKSPHRLAIFNGGHTLPPDSVALEAIEWMEIQAMKSSRRTRDDALIARMIETRRRAIEALTDPAEMVHALEAFVADFDGLHDTGAEARRVRELSQQRDVKKALSREKSSLDAESQMLADIFASEARLADDERRSVALASLRDQLWRLAKTAAAAAESPERSQARRVLRAITSGAAGRVQDREYLALINEIAGRR
jgi:dienelactone hydrolase